MTEPFAVIAIGRNEGERLRLCLNSALAAGAAQVVYVDSGSIDGSVALAESLGAQVVHLDPAGGFTAGKARNAGVAALGGAPPLIQFVDGDCELVPGWVDAARAVLAADPGLAAVAGRRRERAPEASIFNRMCDMEWNSPVGPARAVGGDAMYRADAFAAVSGFDPAFICGEEPELCFRLRAEGWRMERIDAEMTLHDAAITRWSQWAKRVERAGWSFAEGAATYGKTPERYNIRPHQRAWFWGGAVPAGIAAALLAAVLLGAAGSGLWIWALAAALLGLAAYPAMALRIARRRAADRGDPAADARLYGALTMLAKIPELRGAIRYARARARGERGAIIEYKAPADGTKDAS
jgi:GT2 family glycosyltransferase